MDRTGIENQSELRAATNAAVRANLAIYTMDLRGLQALVAGGEAQNASLRGTSAYSGQVNNQRAEFQLHHARNPGHAGQRYRRARLSRFQRFRPGLQRSAAGYFDLLSSSAIAAPIPPGTGATAAFRVKVNVPGVKIDFRRGYYAPADYQHSTKEDKELQLQEELASELPTTDLPLYSERRLFPPGGQQVLHPDFAGRAGIGDSFHAQQRSRQGNARRHWQSCSTAKNTPSLRFATRSNLPSILRQKSRKRMCSTTPD